MLLLLGIQDLLPSDDTGHRLVGCKSLAHFEDAGDFHLPLFITHQGKSSESITLHDDDEALSYAVWVQDWKLPASTNIPDMNTHVTIYDPKKHIVVRPGDDVQERGRKDSHK